jgi:hypothetical protein
MRSRLPHRWHGGRFLSRNHINGPRCYVVHSSLVSCSNKSTVRAHSRSLSPTVPEVMDAASCMHAWIHTSTRHACMSWDCSAVKTDTVLHKYVRVMCAEEQHMHNIGLWNPPRKSTHRTIQNPHIIVLLVVIVYCTLLLLVSMCDRVLLDPLVVDC